MSVFFSAFTDFNLDAPIFWNFVSKSYEILIKYTLYALEEIHVTVVTPEESLEAEHEVR